MNLFSGTTTSLATPVTIYFVKSNRDTRPFNYYSVQLYGVVVTGITQNTTDADVSAASQPTETVTLEAAKYRYSETTHTPSGGPGTPISFGWGCTRNAAF
jgi:hypothetical protein